MKLANILLVFSVIALIFTAVVNTFLPLWILAIIIGFAVVCAVTILFRKKTILKLVLSVLMIGSSVVLYTAHQSIDSITNSVSYETTTFSFIVLKTSKITDITETNGMKFGMSSMTDTSSVIFIQDALEKKISTYNWKSFDDNQSVIKALYAGEIKVMVVDDAIRSALVDEYPDLETKTTTIFSVDKQFTKPVQPTNTKSMTKPFILLISGMDIAGPISSRSRSDVDILVVVNPQTHKILTVSIPRDTYVHLACDVGNGALDKLTHTGYYGIQCTVNTIEAHMGITIDYYVKLNFSSFLNIIKYFGTINVYSQYAFTSYGTVDPATGKLYTFNQGWNNMDATKALAFARERHNIPGSNFQRGLDQQEIIKSLVKRVLQPSSLLNINKLISIVQQNIDTDITSTDLQSLIKLQIDNNQSYSITSSLLMCKGDFQPTYSLGKELLSVCWTYPDKLSEMKTMINDLLNGD